MLYLNISRVCLKFHATNLVSNNVVLSGTKGIFSYLTFVMIKHFFVIFNKYTVSAFQINIMSGFYEHVYRVCKQLLNIFLREEFCINFKCQTRVRNCAESVSANTDTLALYPYCYYSTCAPYLGQRDSSSTFLVLFFQEAHVGAFRDCKS